MSPASYRTAPPRVAARESTGPPVRAQIGVSSPEKVEGPRDLGTGLSTEPDPLLGLALLQRLVGGVEVALGPLEEYPSLRCCALAVRVLGGRRGFGGRRRRASYAGHVTDRID